MSRKFCILPEGFSESVAQNHNLHRHFSKEQVDELVAADAIRVVPKKSETEKPRFVMLNIAPCNQVFRPARVPGAAIVQRAAGAWKEHAREVRWAKRKIHDHVPILSWIQLERLFYDDDGLRWSAKPLVGLQNVEVLFSVLDFEPRKSLNDYRNWMRPGLVIEVARMPKAVAAMKRWQWKQALTALDRNWSGIVSSYRAGPFSAALSQSKPSELPSLVFRETLEALA